MIGLDLVLIVDTGYGRLGVASGEAADRAEEIAALPGVRVVCSVVSAARPGHAVIDAGKKTLTATLDPYSSGHGLAVGRPNVEIHTLSEECGWVRHDGDLQVGDRLQVIPNHACELTNLV